MKATLTIEVPNEFLAENIERYWNELTPEERAEETKPTPDEWMRDRLEDVCGDELRVALWRWPLETEIVSIDV